MEELSREDIIKELEELLGYKTDYSSFLLDDLIATRDALIRQKDDLREDINKWFDEELCEKLT